MIVTFDAEEMKDMLLSGVALKLNMSIPEVLRTSTIKLVNARTPSLEVDINQQQLEVHFNE